MLGQRLFLFLARFEPGRIPGTAGNYIMPKKLEPTSRKQNHKMFQKMKQICYTFNQQIFIEHLICIRYYSR